jgi:hypothetical protein
MMPMLRCPTTAEEAYEPELNIFAVVCYENTYQEITVDRTYRPDEAPQPYVDDAIVVLEGDGLIDTCFFSSHRAAYGTRRTFPIHTGSKYRIQATRAGCATLVGETFVPGDFVVSNPRAYDTLDLSDTIVMTTGQGTALYSIAAELDISRRSVLWFRCNRPDSLVAVPISYLVTDTSWHDVAVEITAFDPNFYKYHYELADSVMRAGVTGGVGLFGSAYVKRIPVYLRPVTEGMKPVAILR